MMEEIIELAYQKSRKKTGFTMLDRLGNTYLESMMAYVSGTQLKDPYTGIDREPNEKLMRDVEDQINIPEQGADDFRRQVASHIGCAVARGEKPKWDDNPHLFRAVQKKLEKDTHNQFSFKKLKRVLDDLIDAEFEVRR